MTEEQQDKNLQQMLSDIRPADAKIREQAQKKWNSIAKPLHSLGKLLLLPEVRML